MIPSPTVRTTLALPAELLQAVDNLIEQGKAARSRNDLITTALRHKLAALERATLDTDFRHMATDVQYQEEAQRILAEFTGPDRDREA